MIKDVYEKSGLAAKVLKFYGHEERFVKVSTPVSGSYNPNNFKYIYPYKDYLGNARLSYTDSNRDFSISLSELVEENHYHPFGLKHKG